MYDPTKTFRTWLLTDSATVALIADRIVGPDLPEGSNPKLLAWMVLRTRGGRGQHPEAPIAYPSIQMSCYAPTAEQAWALYQTAKSFVHGKTGVDLGAAGFVLSCLEEVQGQEFTDPDTGWPTVVAFFGATMRAA